MASHLPKMPYTPSPASRQDSVTPPDYKPLSSPSKVFTIQSMLNPPTSAIDQPSRSYQLDGTSATPTSSRAVFSVSPTTRLATPGTPYSAKRKKVVKDSPMLNRPAPTEEANYLPFELSEQPICLSNDEQNELHRQHKAFLIKPSEENGNGQIRDNTRYIPYSSEKKKFFSKTGKEGFSVFFYTFRLPTDPAQTEYTVMWDYVNGLVRITPFFKACNHSKTVPAKALITNPGLKELAHSITGGALVAQGYWVPYACARAICLTFCYKIRWALTPIFGPSFIRECLPTNHAGYQRFKIDSEAVRCATLEAEGWKQDSSYMDSPAEIPRSVPSNIATGGQETKPRDNRPVFKSGSPFQYGSDTGHESDDQRTMRYPADTPSISPKTATQETFTGPTWTSVNKPSPLTQSLLNQPHQYASWRPAGPAQTTATTIHDRKASLRSQQKPETIKRPRSPSLDAAGDTDYADDTSDARKSSSESDDADIIVSPRKRARRSPQSGRATDTPASSSNGTPQSGKSVKFNAEDFRAAHLLLALGQQDDRLTIGPNGQVGGAR